MRPFVFERRRYDDPELFMFQQNLKIR